MLIKKTIRKIIWHLVYSIFLLSIVGQATAERGLSLQCYLNQVRHYNLAMQAARLTGSGAKERVGEGRLIMRPAFFAEGQYIKDSYNPNWSPITGNNSSLQSYKMGLSETTPFGVQGKLYYNYQHQNVDGSLPFINHTQITASSPIAELNVPLARNFGGRETRAAAQLIDSQARLIDYSQRFNMDMLLARAESTYWRLAIMRQIVAKRHESLARAQEITQWLAKRVDLRLAENADLLQANAALDAKKLDLQAALNDERLAALDFNTLRGQHQMLVCESLVSFNKTMVHDLCLPTKPGMRQDLHVVEQEQRITIANAELGIEKNKPIMDLYASYALNGNNPSSNQAISESFTTNYPSTAVGLRLSIPLDFGQMHRDRCGYRKAIGGARCQIEQKKFENVRLWQSLIVKIENAEQRLHIAEQLEDIQLSKLRTERERLSYGKTTTYQVLLFEQDLVNAEITRLAVQDEVLELMAELKTFGA